MVDVRLLVISSARVVLASLLVKGHNLVLVGLNSAVGNTKVHVLLKVIMLDSINSLLQVPNSMLTGVCGIIVPAVGLHFMVVLVGVSCFVGIRESHKKCGC